MRHILLGWQEERSGISYRTEPKNKMTYKAGVFRITSNDLKYVVYDWPDKNAPSIIYEGTASTLEDAKRIVDDYLISQKYILLDKEPQLAILL